MFEITSIMLAMVIKIQALYDDDDDKEILNTSIMLAMVIKIQALYDDDYDDEEILN